MTHNSKNSSFLEDNESISAKSATQILSLYLALTFLLLSFLITGLCNFLGGYSFTLTPTPDPFFL